MDETPTLRSTIEGAVSAYCSENGFGIPTGFVYCVSRIDADGENVLTLGAMEQQTTAASLGLTRYLEKSFEFEADMELSSYHAYLHADCDEDD